MVIQKILFPLDDRLEQEMFFRLSKGSQINVDHMGKYIFLNVDERVRSNTYFNSFSMRKWKKYTVINTLELYLELQGRCAVIIYGSKECKGEILTEKISYEQIESSDKFHVYKFSIDLELDYINIFFEIHSLGSEVFFRGGSFSTEAFERNCINLALDICTYNRYEYLKRTIDILNASIIDNPSSLLYENLELFIVDNANDPLTFQFASDKVHVFLQNSKGSSGGFTRGMLEINKRRYSTHCIVMDDDIYLYPEILERLYCFLKFLREEYDDALIGGSLMRMDIPYIQHESGALWNDGRITSCKGNINVLQYESVVRNEIEEKTEYMGWWFCCIPMIAIKKNGYPLPVYFHRDDIEFGLRNSKQITLNGICTWHEPFESKTSAINEYYDARNTGILLVLYPKLGNAYKYSKFILKKVIVNLFLYKYNAVDLILCGFEDFLKGADWIIRHDSGAYYNELKKKDFTDVDTTLLETKKFDYDFRQTQLYSKRKSKWLRYAFLNGYLRKKTKVILVPAYNPDTAPFWDAKCAYYYNQYTEKIFYCECKIPYFFKYLMRLIADMVKALWRYRIVQREWNKKRKQCTSREFWQCYLEH